MSTSAPRSFTTKDDINRMNSFNKMLPALIQRERKVRDENFYVLPSKTSKSVLAKLSGTQDMQNTPKLLTLNKNAEALNTDQSFSENLKNKGFWVYLDEFLTSNYTEEEKARLEVGFQEAHTRYIDGLNLEEVENICLALEATKP